MNRPSPAKILVLAADRQSVRHWAAILREQGDLTEQRSHVWCGAEELPAGSVPEVIVAEGDCPVPDSAYPSAEPEAGEANQPQIGVVRIGGSGPADLCLPADVTPRELRLACLLLAQVVRLRRQLRLGTKAYQSLFQQALTDPLTGLPNRWAWDEALAARLADCGATAGPLCLAILDLDHFKPVNDTLGHVAGDAVLRGVAAALRATLRHNDFVARLGGDEFGLLLWTPHRQAAAAAVDRIRQGVAIRSAGTSMGVVTASAGYHVVSQPPAAQPAADALLAAADCALRQAKQQGRDRTVGN